MLLSWVLDILVSISSIYYDESRFGIFKKIFEDLWIGLEVLFLENQNNQIFRSFGIFRGCTFRGCGTTQVHFLQLQEPQQNICFQFSISSTKVFIFLGVLNLHPFLRLLYLPLTIWNQNQIHINFLAAFEISSSHLFTTLACCFPHISRLGLGFRSTSKT